MSAHPSEVVAMAEYLNSLPDADARLSAMGLLFELCSFCPNCGVDDCRGTCANDE